MIVPDNEVLGPEHLAELGVLFDRTWAALGSSANSESYAAERAQLACILLRLYGLRQLGPEQVAQTALRLLQPSATVSTRAAISEADGSREQAAPFSTSASCSIKVLE